MSRPPSPVVYEFGAFHLDTRRRLLLSRNDGLTIPLTSKAIDTLVHLVEHAGEIVDKPALMKAVWPNVRVEENNLSQCISALRRVLGEDPSDHRYIVTAPGRGYRFIAEVRPVYVDSAVEHGADTPPKEPRERESKIRSLAVLPFKPLSMADQLESLALGMTDALISRIGSLHGVVVRPLSSARAYGAMHLDPIAAGAALGVDSVLDGSIQRAGDRIRVSARLFNVSDGRQIWADRFDQEFTNIFDIQDAIAERTAAALVHELSSGERSRLRKRPTDNAQAYQLYVTGWSGLTRPSCDSLEKALRYLEQAVARDPEFALAYACLADAYAVFAVFGGGAPHEIFPKALAAVKRALALDPHLAESHAELGHIRLVYDLDLNGAEAALLRALDVNPNSTMAHHYMGLLHIARGKLEDALVSLRRAQALEPLALNFNANIGMIHYYARRYEEAITQLEITLGMEAGFDHARSLLGRACLQLGHTDRAITEFRARSSTTIGSAADLPAAFARSGRTADAEAELQRMIAAEKTRYISAFDIATVCAALGKADAAFYWLDRAIEQRAQPINFLGVDPAFDVLRADPRFALTQVRLAARTDQSSGAIADSV
jgi:DNA-binding winged helix-turn-helix (wHTH) protein/Tfp pilus assembly protein PilF